MTVLLGRQTTGATADFTATGDTAVWDFVAVASGQLKYLFARTDLDNPTATAVELGIYADSAGTPGALLGKASVDALADARGQRTFRATLATPVAIVSGTKYWIGWHAATENFDFFGASGGNYKESAGAADFQDPMGSTNTGTVNAAVWGETFPDVQPLGIGLPSPAFQDSAFQDGGRDVTNDAFQQFVAERFGMPTLGATVPAGISAAGQIATGAAFGVTKVQRQVREDGSGIQTGESFGTTQVKRQLANAGAVATGAAVGQPKLFIQLAPVGIASGAAVGTPRLLVITAAGGISTGAIFGTTAVRRQVREDGTGVATRAAVGQPVLGNFNPSISGGAGAIPSGEAFGTAKVLRQVREDGTGITSGAAVGQPFTGHQVQRAGGITSTAAVGQPKVASQLGPAGITSGATVGTPRTIRPTIVGAVPSGEAFGRPTLTIPAQPTVVGGTGLPRIIVLPRRLLAPEPDRRPNPAPVSSAGAIEADWSVGVPSLTLLDAPIDALAREADELELLGVL